MILLYPQIFIRMKGDVELVYFYKDWNSVSEVVESLKRLSDKDFILKLYESSFNDSIRSEIPFGNQIIQYCWGKESLVVSFDW